MSYYHDLCHQFVLRHFFLTPRMYQIVNLLWTNPLLSLIPLSNILSTTGPSIDGGLKSRPTGIVLVVPIGVRVDGSVDHYLQNENPGAEISLKALPSAQDPVKVDPKHYNTVFENDKASAASNASFSRLIPQILTTIVSPKFGQHPKLALRGMRLKRPSFSQSRAAGTRARQTGRS